MIAVGVDTHKHQHVAVALSELGLPLGEIAVAASAAGYREGWAVRRWSGSKARAATAPGCASACRPSGSAWWRSSVPAGGIVVMASLTAWTHSRQRNACWLATASQRRERAGTAPR